MFTMEVKLTVYFHSGAVSLISERNIMMLPPMHIMHRNFVTFIAPLIFCFLSSN